MKKKSEKSLEDLIRDLMIIQLAVAGLGQREIRAIVGVDANRVAAIAKHFKKLK